MKQGFKIGGMDKRSHKSQYSSGAPVTIKVKEPTMNLIYFVGMEILLPITLSVVAGLIVTYILRDQQTTRKNE